MPVALVRNAVPPAADPKARRAAGRTIKLVALAAAVVVCGVVGSFAFLRRPPAAATIAVEAADRSARPIRCVAEAPPIEQWIEHPPGALLPASRVFAGADLSAVTAPRGGLAYCDADREVERRAMVRTVESAGAIVSMNWLQAAPDGATKCYTASNRYATLKDPFGDVTAYQLTATWIHGVMARSAAGEVTTTGDVSRWCQVNVGPAYRPRTKD